MAGNWIKVYRKIQKGPLWAGESFSRGQAWIDLLLMARWTPGHKRMSGVRIDLERGQLIASYRFLAERWTWSKGKVIRFVNELKNDTQIDTLVKNGTQVITITNYEQYQSDEYGDGDSDGYDDSTTDGYGDGYGDGYKVKKDKESKEGTKESVIANGHKKPSKRFSPPTAAMVADYAVSIGTEGFDAQRFVDHYQSKGWKVGSAPMKDWKASVRNWLRSNKPKESRLPTDEDLANYNPVDGGFAK